MTPEPMSLREAARIVKEGEPREACTPSDEVWESATWKRHNDYARAVAIVDAAVEAHEARVKQCEDHFDCYLDATTALWATYDKLRRMERGEL